MADYTVVYFTGIKRGFSVAAELIEINFFGKVLTVHTYGAIIAFGFLLAVLLGGRIAYTWKMNLNKMVDVMIYGTLFGIIGARLYYVFSKWDYYSVNLSEIPQIWKGGLAIYGGLIAGIIAAYIVSKAEKMNFLNLLDCCAISFLVGQGIGRWGNYFNQEAFGTNTTLPWGMKSAKTIAYLSSHYDEITARGISIDPNLPVHPTFLYESLWCLLGVLVLYLVCRKFRLFSGQMLLWYGVWYGTERAVVEGLRTDSLYIAGTNIRISQLLSAIIAVVSLVLLIYFSIKYKKHPKPIDGIDYFSELELKEKNQLQSSEETESDDETAEEKEEQSAESAELTENDNITAEQENQ